MNTARALPSPITPFGGSKKVLRLESCVLPSPVSGPEVSASRMRRRSILRRVHKGAFRYLELYRPLRLSLKLSIKNGKGKSLRAAQQTTTTHESSSGKKSRRTRGSNFLKGFFAKFSKYYNKIIEMLDICDLSYRECH